MKKLSHEELQVRQSEILAKSDKVPLIVVLNNILSIYKLDFLTPPRCRLRLLGGVGRVS